MNAGNSPSLPFGSDSYSTSSRDSSRCSVDECKEFIDNDHVPRAQMSQIILDYLINAGHKDAAVNFSREAAIALPVQPSSMDDRVKVLEAAHEGRIADCMKILQESSPDLLEQNMDVYLAIMKQMLLELIRERKISDALQFAQDVLAEKGAEDPALLEDFERAMALLAFDKPEDSPYGDLLELTRREEVKAQLNETLLRAHGRDTESKLATICKLLLWSQEDLKKKGVKFPKLTDIATGIISDDSSDFGSDVLM